MKALAAAIFLAALPFPALEAVSLGAPFERALARAAGKLESPACRLVLEEFRDASGRTLAERLGETGLPASAYLESLAYRSGRDESACRRTRVQAFTSVGGSTIWVCPQGSLGFAAADVDTGSSVLIHEMLHTLGLEENPPTSLEITERVVARCGR